MTAGKVGFARSGTDGTFQPLLPFTPGDPLEAVAMYLETDGERLLLVSLDFGQWPRCACSEIREGMAQALGLPVEAIIFHSTHNHAAPTYEDYVAHMFPIGLLTACLTNASREAVAGAVPARMACVAADVGNRYSLCRRKWINDDVANITNWYGYKDEGPRGARANHLIRERLHRWFGPDFPEPAWLAEPIYYDNPVDPLAQLLAFEDLAGRPLGGMIRFAAHPHLMNSANPNAYATDYPGAARRWLDRARGGIHLFGEGPQCNLAPRETTTFAHLPGKLNWADTPYGPDGSLAAVDLQDLQRDVREMGEGVAAAAFGALGKAEFRPLQTLQVKTGWLDLPMRGDVPDNARVAWEIRDEWGLKIKAALRGGVSIIEMKRMTDQYNRFHWMKKMLDEWYLPTRVEIAAKQLPVHLQAVRINDTCLIGLPAETGLETSLALRGSTLGQNLITLQQCNGDIGYMISGQEQRGGDYESTCGLIAQDGLDVLHEGALALLRQVGAAPASGVSA